MVIDDTILNDLKKVIKAGLYTLENSELYYNIVNNRETSDFIYDNKIGTPHFNFLKEMLRAQHLTSCPNCGHFNDNVECPIIVCEYCSHHFKVVTPSSESVCDDCIASKTGKCNREPISDS